MDVLEVIMDILSERGYDGLYNSDTGCGCVLDDFCHCDGAGILTCVPAYGHNVDSDGTCRDCGHECRNDEADYLMCDKKASRAEETEEGQSNEGSV
jgi:hypothetical protein